MRRARTARPQRPPRRLAHHRGARRLRSRGVRVGPGPHAAAGDARRAPPRPAPRPRRPLRARRHGPAAARARAGRPERGDDRARPRVRRPARLRRRGGRRARRLPRTQLRGSRRPCGRAPPRARPARGAVPHPASPAGAFPWPHRRDREPRAGVSSRPPSAAGRTTRSRCAISCAASTSPRPGCCSTSGTCTSPRTRRAPTTRRVLAACAPDVVLFHVHDNLGCRRGIDAPGVDPIRLDLHLPPGRGSLPWARIAGMVAAARRAGHARGRALAPSRARDPRRGHDAAPGARRRGRRGRLTRRGRCGPAPGVRQDGGVTIVPLTSLSHGAGCGCKLPAAALLPIVRDLPAADDPRLLVGSATGDDAAVYRLADDLALVQTIDFFTPLVDDPFDFGRIAAANALSDVYAMGGRPVTAMNVVAFPLEQLGGDVLREILRGGLEVVDGGGRLARRRALDRRPRAEVRPRGDGRRRPGRDGHERGRPGRRRPRAHEAARGRRDRHGAQARRGGRRRPRRGGRGHDDAERGRVGRRGRRRARTR